MTETNTALRERHSITVFGSSLVRVAPDIASIVVGVSRLEKKPKDAFANAHAGAKAVHEYLNSANITDVGSSRITLKEDRRYEKGESHFVGYEARLSYSILLRDLDRVEELIIGLIGAGANELTSVTFETSRLKEVRAEARRRAVDAGREKAEIYATAAGVAVGEVLAIEDRNPESLSGRREGHVQLESTIDDSGDIQAIDPGAISIGGAVSVVYALKDCT